MVTSIDRMKEDYKRDFKNFQKKVQFFASLNAIIHREGFILKRDFTRINEILVKIKRSEDFRFNSRLALLNGACDQ